MKFEKLSDNKIKITLTLDELVARKIDIKAIEKDSSIARNLFLDLISETDLHEDFLSSDSQLFIEAASDNNNLFIVTITKVELIPELKDYEGLTSKKSFKINKKTNTNKKSSTSRLSKNTTNDKENILYKVSSYIYEYETMDTIIDMCNTLKVNDSFVGKNTLYKFENKYFLIFSKYSVKNKKFLKTFSILSEYSNAYYNLDIFDASIKERAEIIIKDKAIQKLYEVL